MAETPITAFLKTLREAESRVKEIQDMCSNHLGTNPDTLNWADVADAALLLSQLTAITDRLCGRGEYA